MMKRVYICAPLGGNTEENLKKVRRYAEYALRCGTAPVVPHFYAECLDDNNPKDREVGLAAQSPRNGKWVYRQDLRFYGSVMKCGYSGIPLQAVCGMKYSSAKTSISASVMCQTKKL